jgi:hypothetical protein
MEWFSLDSLEQLVLRSKPLQSFVLRSHRRAFRKMLSELPAIRRVAIIGGGMFPRTALVLRELLPEAHLRIVDASAENIQYARAFVNGDIEFSHRFYVPAHSGQSLDDVDLLIIPLSFQGDRAGIYQHPPARNVLIHDWLWRRQEAGVVISLLLLKRLNLVRQ